MQFFLTIVGGFLIAWIFWCAISPYYEKERQLRRGQWRELAVIWATFGVFFAGLFVSGFVVSALWLGRL